MVLQKTPAGLAHLWGNLGQPNGGSCLP
jgi:hypothetical protein